jgi:hypothetical protein
MGSPEWLMPLLPWGKPEIFRIEARAALPHSDTQSPSPSTYSHVFEVSGENGAAVRPQAGPEDPFAELPYKECPTACGKALSAAPKASQVGREESFEAPGWMRRDAKRARRRIRIQRSIYEEARDVARALAKTEAES